MKYRICILAFCLSATLMGNGQSYYFRHYQVENGLSNNAVICSLQDKKGFLWFGTKDGLNRFDGYTFKIFRNSSTDSQSIGNNFIHCIFEDKQGILWVGTENGLYSYNETTENFNLLKGTLNRPVRNITMDGRGRIWFILDFTLYQYDKKGKLEAYPIERFFQTTSICTSSDGELWAATADGQLKKYMDGTDSFLSFNVFAHSPATSSSWIENIYPANQGLVMVGTGTQGAKIFDTRTMLYEDIRIDKPDKMDLFVRNFLQTSPHEIWIATESGIFIYDLASRASVNLQKKYNNPYSISDNAVYSFCKDKEGGIWAGTYFGGVNYYPKPYTPFRKYFPVTNENSLSGNVVREIRQDKYGKIWIGTEDAGLNRLDTATGVFTHFIPDGKPQSISYTNIHGLLVNDDELWIGTFEHGLDVMNIKTGKIVRHYVSGPGDRDLKSNFIYWITRKRNGDIMLGTTIGAYLYNRKTNDFSNLDPFPLHNWYTSLFEEENGTLWAATYGNGLRSYNPKTKETRNYLYDPADKNSISNNRINSIYEDKNKNIWFATEGGLSRYNKKTDNFKTYNTGFPSNFILSVLEDDKNNLWLSTSRGLVCFNPEKETLINYTTINGTLNDQFNFNSAYKDSSGRMYFGSVKGLISFKPDEIIKNDFIPPIYITSFKVFNQELGIAEKGSPLKKSISYTDKVVLDYDQSTVNIGFAALNYTAPDMTEYAYKMEGLDKNWTFSNRNRTAYFTHLPTGTYLFEVKASNSSGIWKGQERKLTIVILPPWWASNYAYAGYILLGICLVSLIVWYYHKTATEKNKRKFEQLASEKEKEIFRAKIDFFTNVAHEIRTPLTLIRGPLEKVMKKSDDTPEIKNNLKIMERNTDRLIDLTGQLLDFRQAEIQGFSLNFTTANISELLEDTFSGFKSLAEQKSLQFTLSLPQTTLYAAIDPDAFNKIMNNLFSNAIKYAENEVSVSLIPFVDSDQSFTIEFRNDGFLIPFEMRDKIFEPFLRLKETNKHRGTGIGLALSKSLVQLHKGILSIREPENNFNVFVLSLPFNPEN